MAQTATWTTAFRVPADVPNDTEESVLGTEWHQEAIGALAGMLRDVKDRRGVDWGVCEQIGLSGLQYPNGDPYEPRPDVMVLELPIEGSVATVALADVGAPLFIAEVASDSTVRHDRDSKRVAYEAIGVGEYIVFDPLGSVMPRPLFAWRLHNGRFVEWEPSPDGWWHSTALDLSIRPTQPFMSMRDRDGAPIELERALRRRVRLIDQHVVEVERARAESDRAARTLEERFAATDQARMEAERAARMLEESLAAANQARAEAERAWAEETRLRRDLEEQLRRLQGSK